MRLVKDQLEEIIIWNRLPRDPSTLGVLGSTWHPRSRPHSLGVGCFQDELANFSPNVRDRFHQAILSEHASNSRTIRNMLHAAAAMWAKSLAHTWNEIRCVVLDTHNSRFEWMKVESCEWNELLSQHPQITEAVSFRPFLDNGNLGTTRQVMRTARLVALYEDPDVTNSSERI
ncbi:hypothetical protein M231_05686 [Tremella mesenterica]|uniref:Uncharacterized protein n=1 Tax=Tremella mesenterica TaxID=5217 RepID=A0A4V1M3I9_TREME|nr:hypothetical protein M231_05686 [Tremella mesenterica]